MTFLEFLAQVGLMNPANRMRMGRPFTEGYQRPGQGFGPVGAFDRQIPQTPVVTPPAVVPVPPTLPTQAVNRFPTLPTQATTRRPAQATTRTPGRRY